jgi:hypothetical protein
MPILTRPNIFACLTTLSILLVTGCGGGGGGGSTSTPSQSPSEQPNTPPPTGDDGETANAAPTISGVPGEAVTVNQTYRFQPSASDPDGDELSFSATNVPSWASFNASNGALSGRPAADDVGTYDGITITVSDGRASASLGPFAITVSDTANGRATLSWTPPTQNTDGSALTNLAGYEIRYGRSENDLSNSISVSNPSISTYVVENLSSGTWYFAVTAVASNGAMSGLSNIASKTI